VPPVTAWLGKEIEKAEAQPRVCVEVEYIRPVAQLGTEAAEGAVEEPVRLETMVSAAMGESSVME